MERGGIVCVERNGTRGSGNVLELRREGRIPEERRGGQTKEVAI